MIKINLKSSFNKNVLVLSGGTAISQLILILISPVLSRLYTPEAFGVFALFLSITAIIGGNINLKFEQAIMLTADDKQAYKLAYLSNYLNFIISFILFVIIVFFFKPIASALNINPVNSYWLYIIPFASYFIGFSTVLSNLNNRLKKYKVMSMSTIAKNGIMTIVQLVLGFLKLFLSSGLIIGQLFAYILGNSILKKNTEFSFREMFRLRKIDIIDAARRYKDFPLFAFPAGIANALTLNVSNILISTVYSISDVGQYSMANRILSAPTVLISQSISQVFYQQASEEYRKKGNCRITFNSTLKKLIFLAIPIFLPVALISRWAFPFIFGDEWINSGVFASYLSIFVGIRFISSPLSTIINITENQKYGLYFNLALLVVNIAIITISYFLKLEMIDFIILYSLSMSFIYSILVYFYFRLAI